MKRTIFVAFVFLLGIILAACGSSVDLDTPPEIVYGEDVCDQCNMIISEARFSAAYITEDGTVRMFDDFGGMCIYHNNHDEIVARFWVHDYETGEWIDAHSAHYVASKDLYTPMSFGVVALSSAESAGALAAQNNGMVMDYEQAFEHLAGMDMGGMHDHDMEGMEDMDSNEHMDSMN